MAADGVAAKKVERAEGTTAMTGAAAVATDVRDILIYFLYIK
jgi:hypothetical protein